MENESLITKDQARQELLRKERAARHPEFNDEEAELWENAKCPADYDAVRQMRTERWQREAQERQQLGWARSEAAELLDQLGYAYRAYKAYLDRQPNQREAALENDAENQKIYDKLRGNLERANNAPRCAHIKASGERCRAPKMHGRRLCNMHLAMQVGPQQHLNLPPLEDPNSIQLAIMKAAQGLVDGTLQQKQAGMLAYYLQLASHNVGRVKFEPEPDNEESEDDQDS